MITDWIYNNPAWLWGALLAGLAAGSASLGLLVVHRLVHVEVRRAHNELAGFLVAGISVSYAVLLAFIAVATWESFSHAQDIVDNGADYVGSIYRDTQELAPAVGQSIRDDLQQYVTTVVNREWPMQGEGETPDQGWGPLRKLHSSIVTIEPTTMGQQALQAELLKALNQLYSARASRLSAVQGHIPDVVWWIICSAVSLRLVSLTCSAFTIFACMW
jgi:hypothetical protein